MGDVKFKGFVEPHEGRGPWTIVENHRRKDENDKWVTVSKTWHRVWLPKGGEEPAEGALVEVSGREETPPDYVKDGEKKKSGRIVHADSVVTVFGRSGRAAVPPVTERDDFQNDDEIPF